MTYTIDDFRKAAETTFQNLKKAFKNSTNFWILGHAFDTIIDYFVTNPTDADGFAEIALDRYVASLGTACWYDDYGWWGIAGLKASQHSDLFGSYASQFGEKADFCWSTMHNNAPNVWEKADKTQFGALQPRFDGGVWNYDWWTEPNSGHCNQPCDPRDPSDTLCGYQNTVTNGLYLILAARLFRATNNPLYQDAANREYSFLNNWFHVPDQDQALLHQVLPLGAVVRERVSTYASLQSVGNYTPELSWAGDQGLILGGLVDMMHVSGQPSNLLGIVQSIVLGVKSSMVDNNNLLLPWIPFNPTPPLTPPSPLP